MKQTLTGRQQELLNFIGDHLRDHGYPPSIREMADHMGIRSTNGVNDHLKALERKGYIGRKEDLKSRAIALTERARPTLADPGLLLSVPLLGRVAAGLPIMSEENFEGELSIGSDLLPGRGPLFALTVTGDSMIDLGIHDGDTVFVRKQATARAGEVVVALIDGEATVKTYRPSARAITFEAANPDYPDIVVPKGDFRATDILGDFHALTVRTDCNSLQTIEYQPWEDPCHALEESTVPRKTRTIAARRFNSNSKGAA